MTIIYLGWQLADTLSASSQLERKGKLEILVENSDFPMMIIWIGEKFDD